MAGVVLMGTSYSFVVLPYSVSSSVSKFMCIASVKLLLHTHTHTLQFTHIDTLTHTHIHYHTPTKESCKLCIYTFACNLCSGIFNFLKQFSAAQWMKLGKNLIKKLKGNLNYIYRINALILAYISVIVMQFDRKLLLAH